MPVNSTNRDKVLALLRQPFPIDLLYYKPQAVSAKTGKALAAVYADPRAYQDRLNIEIEDIGPDGWEDHYQLIATESGKLMCVCTVTIHGLGTHSDVGEEPISDKNAATIVKAQAMKRALLNFGLGRYLYDFPKGRWYKFDKDKNKWIDDPNDDLPDFAIPKELCRSCGKEICSTKVKNKKGTEVIMKVPEILANSVKNYGLKMCVPCQMDKAAEAQARSGNRAAAKATKEAEKEAENEEQAESVGA